ncbi:MAG: type II secretion system protein [Pyrinomonadaceae bacterium]
MGGGEGKDSLPLPPSPLPFNPGSARGWTLIELVITMTVMAVLAMAIIPIVRTSIRRQRELRLREVLREMRGAIDEFHRDTVGMQCAAGGIGVPVAPVAPAPGPNPGGNQTAVPIDPRSRVYISDCTIFGVDNPERYPPSLETLVEGVDVLPRAAAGASQFGSVDTSRGGATANAAPVPKKKKYLREIPVDPMTGRAEWCLLSQYDEADSGCSSNVPSVFDVRSKSDTTALNGKEKYSEW